MPRYRCPQAQAAWSAASKGNGEPRGPTASGVVAPGELRRRPGRGEVDVTHDILVGGAEGDEFVIEAPGGDGEDRPRQRCGRAEELCRGFAGERRRPAPLPRLLPARRRKNHRRVLDPARPLRLPPGDDTHQAGAAAAVGKAREFMDRRDLPLLRIDSEEVAENTLFLTPGIRARAGRKRAGQDLQRLDGGQDHPPGDVMIAEVGSHRYRHRYG